MSGIEVSGGGTLAVTTESLLEARRMLEELRGRSESARTELAAAVAAASCFGGGPVVLLEWARSELAGAAEDAVALAAELWRASEAYGLAERVVTAQQELFARLTGPVILAENAALTFAVGSALRGGIPADDPRLVTALRALADSLELPALVAMVAVLPGAALEETGVRVSRTGPPADGAAPRGFTDLADRIPDSTAGAPQLRVERYDQPDGSRHWIVYATGTIDWSLVPGDEPWDDTSNVVGVAGGSAASTRAAVAVLRAAGWQPGDPVLPVGHSQGGIVAAGIAASGAIPVPMLVTFGSPTAGAQLAPGVTDVAVEHTDDPVPALGGSPRLADGARLVVRESTPALAAAEGRVPSHALSGYRVTAEQMDQASDARLMAARNELRAFTGGRPGEVTLWRAERVPASPPPLSGRPAAAG